MPELSSVQIQKIREFINSNQLINAVKLYREATGAGLAEAKDAVEAMARGETVNIVTSAPQTQIDALFLENKIKELLAKKRKIEAVKLYRETHGGYLKDAKDAVDQIEISMRREGSYMSSSVVNNDPFTDDSVSARTRLIIVVAFLLLVFGGLAVYFLGNGF